MANEDDKADQYAKYPQAVKQIRDAWAAGVRASDWSADDLAGCRQKTKGSHEENYVLLLSYYQAMDSGEFVEALNHIRRAHAKVVTGSFQETEFADRVRLEYSYLLSCLDRALPKARLLLESLRSGKLEGTVMYLRAKAALAIAEGDSKASDYLSQAETRLANAEKRDSDTYQAEADWLRHLRRLLYRYEG